MVITDIEPKTVTVGETVKFVLTVQNYNLQTEGFSLADQSFTCSTYDPETNLLKCDDFTKNFLNKIDLYNLKKTLFVDGKPTNVSVTFKRPSVIKTLDYFYINDDYMTSTSTSTSTIYTNQFTKFTFRVNDNELYNPNIVIQFKTDSNKYYILINL